MQNRRKRIKERLVAFKGGACERCGYDRYPEVMEFHHLDPDEKDFEISQKANWAYEKLLVEVEKCMMVCPTCHRELHIEERQGNTIH